MKRNDEDKLIDLAFGELTAEEAEQLRASASSNPKLARTLSEYSEMREGLACLKEIPEMQLSCDRLRDAILAGGLKEPRSIGWNWVGVPIALAALAFVVTLAVKRPQPTLPPVAVTTPVESRDLFDPSIERGTGPVASIKPNLFGTFEKATPEAASKSIVKPSPVVRTAAKVRVPERETSKPAPVTALDGGARMGLTAEGAPTAPLSFGATEPTVTSNPPEATLIVIEPDKLLGIGAQRATEVETSSNVVMGG